MCPAADRRTPSIGRSLQIVPLRGPTVLITADLGESGAWGMARVVALHGIGKQTPGEETLRKQWLPVLNDVHLRAPVNEP
ncbi:hypothetical protein M2162_008116 [Streptomyces sp. SAI-041]|nr:hypothetical protein [Streptomyces sp. SAI-041]